MECITQEEVKRKRSQFGKNGRAFLITLNKDRIISSKKKLSFFLRKNKLKCRIFLDITRGSGLASIVSKMEGAPVSSFDYGLDSVACAEYLKEKYFPND